MVGWNFADVWETVADSTPASIAQIHGDRRQNWHDLSRRADGVAAALLDEGLSRQDKVALLLYNSPEYLETAFAAMKVSLVPVNTNYRYQAPELEYLWDNADAAAVVFHGELTDRVATARERLPLVRCWMHVDDGTVACPAWATPYEEAASSTSNQACVPWNRSGDDLILIYTGGSTGQPKGVMWRQHDLYRVSDTAHDPTSADLVHVAKRLRDRGAAPVGLPAAPLMHGTGFVFASSILTRGGTVDTLPSRVLDVEQMLETIQRDRVTALCIVGDAFGRPIVDALDEDPLRWDVSSLEAVSSAGMAWSPDVKQRLLAHAPNALLVDLLNSSEASGMGRSIISRKKVRADSGFTLGKNAFVVDDAGAPVEPGSGQIGRLAVSGHLPLGYYKDPAKTAVVFPTVNGVRCSIPGDYAVVGSDGVISLLGRGSTCINTGGEKVFPEEVEGALITHPDVVDALVVGIADERFGEIVGALVQGRAGAALTESELIEHVRSQLARYKAPRHVMLVTSVGRGPHGKPDYPQVRRRLMTWLSSGKSAAGAGTTRD
ncbi:MAG: acyl-CoA synthetase [Acidimicrobiales bacterium]